MTRKTVSEQDREVLLRATAQIAHSAQTAWREVSTSASYVGAMLAMRDHADDYAEHHEAATIVLQGTADNLSEVHAVALASAYAYAEVSKDVDLTKSQLAAVTLRWQTIVALVEATG